MKDIFQNWTRVVTDLMSCIRKISTYLECRMCALRGQEPREKISRGSEGKELLQGKTINPRHFTFIDEGRFTFFSPLIDLWPSLSDWFEPHLIEYFQPTPIYFIHGKPQP